MPVPFAMLTAKTTPNKTTLAVSHQFFRTIDAAGGDWDVAAPAHDIFLQRQYLAVVENHPPKGMRFGYIVFYRGNMPVGIALCQIKYFKAGENIQELEPGGSKAGVCFFTAAGQWLKKQVADIVAADVLICGNLLLTGEHGYYFNSEQVNPAEAPGLLGAALTAVAKVLEKTGIRTPITLIKDVLPTRIQEGRYFGSNGYVPFLVQPNMVMDLPFRSFDDYLMAMSTKYRTRAKRAFKKLEGVVKREMSVAEVMQELPGIYHLYREIAKNAGFNMVDLNEQYLLALKRDFAEYFRIFGYYQEDRLIAFYTTIHNGHELEAHFLGYEQSLNHHLQLYLNMLYDLVRHGIEAGCHHLIFARTALEIKSSVGAVAQDLHCYLRHHNSFTNHFTEPMLNYLNPVEVWEPRHPFKET